MNRYLPLLFLAALSACHSRSSAPEDPQEKVPAEEAVAAPAVENQNLQRTIEAEGFSSKGTIQAVTEVPVYSRISEQIVSFDIELGQRVRKGEVVVRLSQDVLKDKIARGKAELENAEYHYQAILMGQGYKRGQMDDAPEEMRQQARINSGYYATMASLKLLEREITYCTITAPITGAVSRIEATLYGAATPGVPLFYIVDTEHLKVCFDVLENELHKFQTGTRIRVISVAYPSEVHQAEVSAISPVVEKNGMVHLEATLQPHPHLMPGMTAIVTKDVG
jgi:RND family efflux transporter MFP subunit